MTAPAFARDYRLTGAESGPGFAHAEWYASPVPRKRMKELMKRSDRAGLIDFGLWAGLTIAFGALLIWVWGSVWAWPVALVYGVLYPSLLAAYREIVPAVIRQQTDFNHYVRRPLPAGAGPTPAYQRPLIAAE